MIHRVVVAAVLFALLACQKPAAAPLDAGTPARAVAVAVDAGSLRPPIARTVDAGFDLHGVHFEDPYAWMRQKGTPEIEAHLAAENAYTDEQLRPLEPLRRTLVAELRARLQEDDDTARWPMRGYEYWRRTRKAHAYESWWRAPKDGGAEQLVFDLNAEADGGTFASLGEFDVTDDDGLLALSVDHTGFRSYDLAVKDLATGALVDGPIPHVASLSWAADRKTLFYTVENDAKRPYRLYRHTVGTPAAQDPLVYEEKDERFDLTVGRTISGRFVVVESESHTTTELRVVEATKPTAPLRVVWPRKQDVMYDLEDVKDRFVLRVNDTGRTYRVISVPIASPKSKPVELVPMRKDVMIEAMHVSARYLVLQERYQGLQRLRALEHATGAEQVFDLPEGDMGVGLADNADFESTRIQYQVTSLVMPKSTFERDLATGTSRLLKQQPVPGYDPTGYETLRVEATAADGTKVPISIARKKGLKGPAPLLLRGYGAYGDNYDPVFHSDTVSLLDRGVVVAESHIRGGGEMGKAWHDDGRMAHKMNTFTDFIACAEYLQREGYTTKDLLVVNGGSAGGLLMGAVLNLRPELFKAAYVEVPFTDVINTMLDESIPLTVIEYEEWGNPHLAEQFEWMRVYSPYDNLKAQAYPTILVRSAYNDSQVLFHEPSKWVARLRATKTDANPLLLWMEMKPAGHGGRANRYEVLEDSARELSFMLWQWGLAR